MVKEIPYIEITTKYHECCFISIPKKDLRVIWELTHFCPRKCSYCFTSSSESLQKNKEYLAFNHESIINKLFKLDVKDVLLTGGEPLSLGEELLKIIKLLNKYKITYSISTTGQPNDILREVCKLSPRRINLSFDPESQTGNNIWKSDIKSLEKLLDIISSNNISVKLTSVITKNNFEKVDLLLKTIKDTTEKYANIQKIAFMNEYSIGRGLYEEGLSLDEIRKINIKISESELFNKVSTSLVNWPSVNMPLQSCPAGKTIFSIMPDGQITPCSLLYNLSRSFATGDIVKDEIKIINEKLKLFSEGVESHIGELKSSNSKCVSCRDRKKCGGGCFAVMPVLLMNHHERIICKIQPSIITDEQKKIFAEITHPTLGNYKPPSTTTMQRSELSKKLEEKIKNFAMENSPHDDLAHGFEHIECVVNLAKYIAEKEGANKKIVITAAYLHDVVARDSSMHYFHTMNSAMMAESFLRGTEEFSNDEILHIRECIITSSYGSFLLGCKPISIEAKIVRDADWLDAIGARGIARVFVFGQAHGSKKLGNVEYSPKGYPPIIFEMNLTGPDQSPIHHFYTKLLKLRDLMETQTGQKIAEEKHKFMIKFLENYAKEQSPGEYFRLQASLDMYNKL